MGNRGRIYFVNRYFFPDDSATAQLLTDLAFALAAGDFDVHVVCSRQRYSDANARLAPRESIRNVTVHRIGTTRFGRKRLLGRALDYATFYVSCFLCLVRQLRRGDVVVAKTDPPLISIVAALCTKLKGAILVNWLQDIFPEVATRLGANPLPGFLDRGLRRLRNSSLHSAAVNVALGGRMREFLCQLGIQADRIRIIQNWAASEASGTPTVIESRLRTQLNHESKFVVGYSGNLGRAHEYRTLLGGAEILRDDSDIVFLMIGGGVHMEALQSEVLHRSLPNFRFLPYQPRDALSDSLAAADVHLVCLLPAVEGLIVPSKFYGILAAARPVIFIGDPDGEVARVIDQSGCGLVVESGKALELAAAIRRLRDQPAECSLIGARSRRLSDQEYSAASAQHTWTELLNGLLRLTA